MSIRPIEPRDAHQLGDLFVALAASPDAGQFHPHPLTRDEATRLAANTMNRKDLYYAAFQEDRLAGYAMLRGWDEGYDIPSFGVAVRAEDRGKGIARRLLHYGIAAARDRGARKLMLKVHLDNPRARRLYDSEGFVFEPIPDDPRQVKGLLELV